MADDIKFSETAAYVLEDYTRSLFLYIAMQFKFIIVCWFYPLRMFSWWPQQNIEYILYVL